MWPGDGHLICAGARSEPPLQMGRGYAVRQSHAVSAVVASLYPHGSSSEIVVISLRASIEDALVMSHARELRAVTDTAGGGGDRHCSWDFSQYITYMQIVTAFRLSHGICTLL